MATRVYHASGNSEGNTTTQSATVYTDHRVLTFTPDASSTYLILGYCDSNVDDNSNRTTDVRLYDDTAAAELILLNWECNAASGDEWQPFTFMQIVTFGASPPSQTYKIQHKLQSVNTGTDSQARNGSLVALKLTAADATATADTGGDSAVSAPSWTDATTVLTFTPGTSGDYLVLAWAKGDHSALGSESRHRLLCEDGTTEAGLIARVNEHDSATGNRSTAFAVKRTSLAASSQTFKIQHSRAVSSGTSTISMLRYVALRLDGFEGNTATEDTTADTTTSASYADAGDTRTDTLTSGIDYLLLASFVASHATAATLAKVKVTDGTNTYAEPAIEPENAAGGQSGMVARIVTGSGASVTHAVQLASETGTATLAEHRLFVLQVEAAGGTNANAGHASGTGAASGATTSVAPAGGHAAGTGTANAGQASIAPPAGHASGTGAAFNASCTFTGNADAQTATGTGTAQTPQISIATSAGHSAGTGAALDATVVVGTLAAAGHASGTGAAQTPQTAVAPAAGHAAGTGSAFDATVTRTGAPQAGHAAGTGTANSVTATVAPVVGAASGTGTASSPQVSIAVQAGHASGTGTAYDATVTTGGAATNAPAGNAAGTGTAHSATVRISVSAVLASATGVAYDPGGSIAPVATTATATATGYAPAPSVAPSGGHAAGTGASSGLTARVAVGASIATATGTAYDATTTGGGPDLYPETATIRATGTTATVETSQTTSTVTTRGTTATVRRP